MLTRNLLFFVCVEVTESTTGDGTQRERRLCVWYELFFFVEMYDFLWISCRARVRILLSLGAPIPLRWVGNV